MKRLTPILLAATLGATSASACEVVYGYQYKMDDAAYMMELNGVFMNRTAEPGNYGGGGGFMQWMVEGENTLSVTMEQGSAEVEISKGCQGQFDGETLVKAQIGPGETRDLVFFVENAPPAVYADNAPLTDNGLADAVAALKAATEARDFDTYWAMHEGLIMQATSMGFPEAAMRGMIGQTVAEGVPSYEDDLTYTPVLGGRVWQVMTADKKAPIRQSLDGGSMIVETGVFWTKIDGKWRITGR